ncbi:MAG: hypothetical protein O2973_00520 [Gemmatimonadetes bacterium]|nr:hypothetical protein [Gemmatimonadota bacterium]
MTASPGSVAAPSTPADPGYATLASADASVTLLPALGGRVRDVWVGGRQWLWHNPDAAFSAEHEDASLGEAVGSGGFDECFPTVAACKLPSWVDGAAGAKIAERGALWQQRCETAIGTDEFGNSATCRWTISPLTFSLTRTITLRPDGTVEFAYAASNVGTIRMPFIWAAHPVFPLADSTRIILPKGAKTRVWMSDGIELAGGEALHAWPQIRAGGHLVDVSRPAALGERYACTMFVELPRTETAIVIREGRKRLELRVHGRELSHAGIWINRGVLAPTERKCPLLRWKRPRTYSTVTIGPCLGAPESLTDALGAWNTARWIEPGATARWAMTWRAVKVEEDA